METHEDLTACREHNDAIDTEKVRNGRLISGENTPPSWVFLSSSCSDEIDWTLQRNVHWRRFRESDSSRSYPPPDTNRAHPFSRGVLVPSIVLADLVELLPESRHASDSGSPDGRNNLLICVLPHLRSPIRYRVSSKDVAGDAFDAKGLRPPPFRSAPQTFEMGVAVNLGCRVADRHMGKRHVCLLGQAGTYRRLPVQSFESLATPRRTSASGRGPTTRGRNHGSATASEVNVTWRLPISVRSWYDPAWTGSPMAVRRRDLRPNSASLGRCVPVRRARVGNGYVALLPGYASGNRKCEAARAVPAVDVEFIDKHYENLKQRTAAFSVVRAWVGMRTAASPDSRLQDVLPRGPRTFW